eukprot:3631914-Amphidinium_carterae.1
MNFNKADGLDDGSKQHQDNLTDALDLLQMLNQNNEVHVRFEERGTRLTDTTKYYSKSLTNFLATMTTATRVATERL